MPPVEKRVSVFQKISYGTGEFFNATTVVIILMLYLKFLTDVVGLSPLWAGICVVAGKAWDAVSDPLIGNLSDRTSSRFGRRRVFFLLFALPASLSFVAMWLFLSVEATWVKVVYYSLAYVTFKTLSSLLMVPYGALGPELSADYDERTSIVVYRMVFSPVGAIVAGVVPNLIVQRYAEAGQPEQGHLVVAAVFGAVYTVIWYWIFAALRERPQQRVDHKTPLWRALRRSLSNRSFRLLITLYLGAFIALDILTASTKYFIDEYLRHPSWMPMIMGTMLGCAMISLPGYFLLIRRLDRKTAYMLGAAIWAVGLLALFTLTAESSVALVLAVMAVIGLGVGAAFVTPWSMVPEVIDVETVRTGRSEEGIYTGIMTFLRKATTSIAIFGIASSLEIFGYLSPDELGGGTQPRQALGAIRVFTALIPAVIVALSSLVAWRYPITKRAHGLVRRELEGGDLSEAERSELEAFLDHAYGARSS